MSTTTLQQLPTGTWSIDPVHSTAEFSVKHLGINTFRNSFATVEGGIADGVLSGRVPVESIRIDNPDFKGHVLSPDFFDAANTPYVEFNSSDVAIADDGSVTVKGDLTIRGTTLPVEATGTASGPVGNPYGQNVLALELSAVVDRFAYGLTWQADLPNGGKALGEKVTLNVHLELVEQA